MGVRIAYVHQEASSDSLKLEFCVIRDRNPEIQVLSEVYAIASDRGGSVLFQMMFNEIKNGVNLSVKLTKEPNDDLVYTIDYNQRFGKVKTHVTLTTDDCPWRALEPCIQLERIGTDNSGYAVYPNSLIINISLKVPCQCTPYSQLDVPKTNPHLASLHEDTELVDFEMQAEDGSVHLHKAIAAAVSPVLRTMFSGAWRETSKGVVEAPGTTKATLQHFKDYIYLDTIPEEAVEQLLLLASFYMMPDLEQRCVNKLKDSVTAETASDLIFLAVNNRSHHLLFAILDCVQKGALNVDEIRSHYKTS